MDLRICTRSQIAYSKRVCAVYNRDSENNARISHNKKEIWSDALRETVDSFLTVNLGKSDRMFLLEFMDRRTVVLLISQIIANQKEKAKENLLRWKPKNKYALYKFILGCLVLLPSKLTELLYYSRV
ncbi:hypothetical protein FACS1894184_18650 [Clostridia bacterium]|nr:hypothetical protein FACS1894184_18650 [Clostridia bacterium]